MGLFSSKKTDTNDSGLSLVEQKGSSIITYDGNGKLIKSISSSGGILQGYGTDFFVVTNGNVTNVYDSKCSYIKNVLTNNKKVMGVGGNTFSVNDGNVITIYDKNCKIVGTKKVSAK